MTIKKPDQVLPSSPTSTPSPMPLQIPDTSIRGEAHSQILQNRGIRFLHKKATPCPNIQRLDDDSHEPNCPICDDNGFIYYYENNITGTFVSNSLEKIFERQGIWEIGSAIVSLPTSYSDGTEADFNTYDQLVVLDYEVRMWEIKEFEPTPGGIQQLRYPITHIEYMSVVDGDVLRVLVQGVDFNIVNGNIQWVVGRQPGYNNAKQRGNVFTVSYFANPIYNVVQTLRELRVTQQMVDGVKTAVRLPMEVLVKRDFLPNGSEKRGGP